MQKHGLTCVLACFAAVFSNPAAFPAREPARLVIYDGNFCVVSESVVFKLERGGNSVRIGGLPGHILPDSVNLEIKEAPGAGILKQRYLPPADEKSLLKANEGNVVKFEIVSPDGKRWVRDGKIIRAGREPLIEFDGMLRFGLPGKPLFEEIPGGIYPDPSLLWTIESRESGEALGELSYITGGINWKASYDMVLSDDEGYAELKGRFLMANSSGKTFRNAAVSLLAGDISKKSNMHPPVLMRSADFEAADVSRAVSRELDEYHLYSVAEPVTLADGGDAHVEFLQTSGFKTEREYIFEGASRDKVQVFIEFENVKKNNLGIPIPGGLIRIYRDEDGFRILTGEDSIAHTPEGEKIRLYTGTSFDLAGERKQTGQRNISPREREEDYEITVRNRKDEEVVLNVQERASHMDWEIRTASAEYEKIDARTFKFRVSVPPGEEKKVSYTVRLRW